MNNNFDLFKGLKKPELNFNFNLNFNYYVLIRIPIISNLDENNINVIGIYENFEDAKNNCINISEFKYIIKSSQLYKSNTNYNDKIFLKPEFDNDNFNDKFF